MASTGRARIDAVVATLLRRKWLALAVFSLCLSGVLSFAKALPNLYQSAATVIVERPMSSEGMDDTESRLQSIRQEILSRTRLAELIGRLNLYPKLRGKASQDSLVALMRRDVRIEASGSEAASGRGTIAFSMAYRGRDPQQVALVANALTSSYIEEDSRRRDRQTSGAASVLQGQLGDVKSRLARQEALIADFKKTHAGALPQQAEVNLAAVDRLDARIQRVADAQRSAMERRATLLKGADESESATADPDRARLDRLNQELREMRTRFSDLYPDVINKKAEIAALSSLLAKKPRLDRALPELEQANREIRALQAEDARLKGESASYQRRVAQGPLHEQEFQALSRDYTTTKDFYESLLRRYEEAQLAEAHEGRPRGQRLRLLDPAIAAVEPFAPDRLRLAMFGLIASLGLALVTVAAAARLDTSFHSADELRQHTRVPILARIPLVRDPTARARGRRQAALLALGLIIGIAFTVKASRILASENDGVVALLAPRGRS
jgi:polysaccharide chain length determinant protein (PEP-CTERM system associated)